VRAIENPDPVFFSIVVAYCTASQHRSAWCNMKVRLSAHAEQPEMYT
jgi:hypothetical protein